MTSRLWRAEDLVEVRIKGEAQGGALHPHLKFVKTFDIDHLGSFEIHSFSGSWVLLWVITE
jgi:hypothetical protein